jgi:hypothetical protein
MVSALISSVSCSADSSLSPSTFSLSWRKQKREVDRVVHAKVTLRTAQPLPSWGKSPVAVWSLWHGPFLPGDVGLCALLVFSPCLVLGP